MSAKDLPLILQSPIDILLIDNFDSFTYNLYQSLGFLGCTPVVIRNDLISPSLLPFLNIQGLIISPGPGHPQTDSGISRDAIKYFAGKVPILGVCMGLECVVDVYGGEIAYAGEIMHGKVSEIKHDGCGILKSIPQSFRSTRYHSLSASLTTLPSCLAITAITTSSGVIMGVRHRKYTIESVQYHPESILSEHGDTLLKNFLQLRGGTWDENPNSGVLDTTLPPFPIEALKINGEGEINKPKTQTILEKIYAQRLKDVTFAKSTPGTTPADLSILLSMNVTPPLIPLVPRLLSHTSSASSDPPPPALMAEIKRASPSKGDIALSVSAPAQALIYALSGASVISVLTEPQWFRGSLADLAAVRQAVSNLPDRPAILRKDFVLDEYQIAEARIHGADTVLLIVVMLPPHRLKALYAYSLKLGMEPLVEVNNANEMTAALDLGAKVIGVNNRNLHDFTVDMGTTSRLADMVRDKGVILCALSGISSSADVQRYAAQGIGAILVGEALMRAKDTRAFIRNLLSLESVQPNPSPSEIPLVKICGIRTAAEARSCASAGADMLGLMFVPTSKRVISLSTAREISSVVRDLRVSSLDSPSSLASTPKPWFTMHAQAFPKSRPILVGVFQNQPLEYILHVISSVQIDMVQLHGNEAVEWAKFIPVPVIKAFGVEATSTPTINTTESEQCPDGVQSEQPQNSPSIPEITRPGYHQFALLDSLRVSAGLSGGTGKCVDWESARRVVDAGEFIIDKDLLDGGSSRSLNSEDTTAPTATYPPMSLPIILAGGLTPSNVAKAIAKVRPWAVDVSGGVEVTNGTGKDAEKVLAFIEAAKGSQGNGATAVFNGNSEDKIEA